MDVVVVLPEHLHCILTLPDGDSDFSIRWGGLRLIFRDILKKASAFQKAE